MIRTAGIAPLRRVLRNTVANGDVVDQIYSFERLQDGWHYGEGCSATELAVRLALWANSRLVECNASDVEVFPDVDGGILVSGYHEDETLEILCGPTGQIDMVHEDGENVIYERKNTLPHEVLQYLRGLSWESMKLSGFFIQSTSAGDTGGLRVWLSRIPPTKVVYRLSTHNVLENVVEPNAHTYIVSTTPKHQEIPPSFGELIQPNYQIESGWNSSYHPTETNAI